MLDGLRPPAGLPRPACPWAQVAQQRYLRTVVGQFVLEVQDQPGGKACHA